MKRSSTSQGAGRKSRDVMPDSAATDHSAAKPNAPAAVRRQTCGAGSGGWITAQVLQGITRRSIKPRPWVIAQPASATLAMPTRIIAG